jgi:hypothetical protein
MQGRGVTSKSRQDWRARLGRPDTVVLFRTPLKWRFAVYCVEPLGILDGALTDEPADSSPESAQAAMRQWAQDSFQRPLMMAWTPGGQPDWWTGAVSAVAGTPGR